VEVEARVTVGLSALIAGLVAMGVTRLVERLGGRWGGLLGALPSSIVPFSLGLWAAGPGFDEGMAAVPVGMLVDAGFLAVWRHLPPRLPGSLRTRLLVTVVASLAAWAVGAGAFVATAPWREGCRPAAVGLVGLVALTAVGLALTRSALPAPRGARPVGVSALLARGALAAAAVGVAVALGASGAPALAGMASVFPAIFLTTMVSLWLAQGEAVPLGAVGPMVLGSTSVGVYALLALVTFPALGPLGGAAVAWVGAALLGTAPAAGWLATR
jgi:hypothetical protein